MIEQALRADAHHGTPGASQWKGVSKDSEFGYVRSSGRRVRKWLVQLLSHLLFVHKTSLTFTISQSFLKLMSIESVMPYNHLILCHPFLLLPSIFPSIRVFSNDLAIRIRWPKYSSFSFSVSPSSEYSGSISFRMYWFDLLAVQGTLKSLLQNHSSKASILWHWELESVRKRGNSVLGVLLNLL